MTVKLFRDPVYDYIAINDEQHWILDLINTPEMQRLRFISQLGLCNYTYPGATHSRFSHSLGVFHLMHQVIQHLKQEYSEYFKEGDENALLAASLLHDIGHYPLSHVTENAFGVGNHEKQTVALILDISSSVNKILSRTNPSLPQGVARLISKSQIDNAKPCLWQKSLISSQLDMDRLDYLQRDSLCSGAEYGNFDCFRIIHTMKLHKVGVEKRQEDIYVIWPEKTKYALEEYLFSRFYMYQSVYFHHNTRAYESLVRKILLRAKDLLDGGEMDYKSLLPPLSLLQGNQSINLFLDLTDSMLLTQIILWQNHPDKILRDLSQRLIKRDGISWAEFPQSSLPTLDIISKQRDQIKDVLKKEGFDPLYYLIDDKTGISPYEPYSALGYEELSSINAIMLYSEQSSLSLCEISRFPGLERLQAISGNKSVVYRYYFPKEARQSIIKILQQ